MYSYLGSGLIDSHFYSVLRPPSCSSLTPSLCDVARKEVISAEGHTPTVYHIELSKATTLLKSIEDEHHCISGQRNILLDQTSLCELLPIFFIHMAFVILNETLSLSLLLTFYINLKQIFMYMFVIKDMGRINNLIPQLHQMYYPNTVVPFTMRVMLHGYIRITLWQR